MIGAGARDGGRDRRVPVGRETDPPAFHVIGRRRRAGEVGRHVARRAAGAVGRVQHPGSAVAGEDELPLGRDAARRPPTREDETVGCVDGDIVETRRGAADDHADLPTSGERPVDRAVGREPRDDAGAAGDRVRADEHDRAGRLQRHVPEPDAAGSGGDRRDAVGGEAGVEVAVGGQPRDDDAGRGARGGRERGGGDEDPAVGEDEHVGRDDRALPTTEGERARDRLVGGEGRVGGAVGRPLGHGDLVVADLTRRQERAVGVDVQRGPAAAGGVTGGDHPAAARRTEARIEVQWSGEGRPAGCDHRGQDEEHGNDGTAGRGHPPHHGRARAPRPSRICLRLHADHAPSAFL